MRRLVAALLLLSGSAGAQPFQLKLMPIPPGDDRIEPLVMGQPAPFTGQLFENNTALRWGHYLEQCRVRLVADVELQRKTDEAQIEYLKAVVQIQKVQYATVTADYQAQVATLKDPPFYRTVWFGVVLGAGAVLATGVGAIVLTHELK